MPRKFLDWVRNRFKKPDGDQGGDKPEPRRRRFQPFKRIREGLIRMFDKISGMLPKWAAGFLLQGLLIFIGAPWWVWPVIAIAAWALFGGFF